MLSEGYRTFLESIGDALHVTAHSHHPWPDVTRAAHLQYWEDSARLTNRKWQEKVFGAAVPEAQGHVARHLGLADPGLVAFAPNTHEFVARLYSCLDWSRRPRVLTTTGEFHSFGRQTRRLEETGRLAVTRVPVEPYATFRARFGQALNAFYAARFRPAHDLFAALAPEDPPSALYAQYCQELMDHPPESWSGVWVLTEK